MAVRGAAQERCVVRVCGQLRWGSRRPHELSGSQAQWIALVPALCAPQLLLLDEPLAALDVRTKTEVRGRLRDELTRQLEVGP